MDQKYWPVGFLSQPEVFLATLDQPFLLTEWRKVDFDGRPMTPKPTLGYSKEPAFQAGRDGTFRLFVQLFVMVQGPKKPTEMIFQWGLNTGNFNFAHSYCLVSSKLQNSGHHSPLEWWYFNAMGSKTWHSQCFTLLFPYQFKIAKYLPPQPRLEW